MRGIPAVEGASLVLGRVLRHGSVAKQSAKEISFRRDIKIEGAFRQDGFQSIVLSM